MKTNNSRINEQDSRLSEVGPIIDLYTRRGGHPDVIRPLAPALLSANEGTRQAAERWLDNHLTSMGDLSDEAQADRRAVALEAQRFAQSLGEAPIPGTEARFNPSDADINTAMDEASPANYRHYPGAQGGSAGEPEPLTLRDTMPSRETGFSNLTESDIDSMTDRQVIDLARRMNLPEARRAGRTVDLSNSTEGSDESPYGSRVNRPFFMDED